MRRNTPRPKPKPQINIPFLERIKRRILRFPDEFRMDKWTCGTAHCVAGTAVVLRGFKIGKHDVLLHGGETIEEKATELLGLTPDQALCLFYVQSWPDLFRNQYSAIEWSPAPRAYVEVGNTEAYYRECYAKIAAARIDHFIRTKGAE